MSNRKRPHHRPSHRPPSPDQARAQLAQMAEAASEPVTVHLDGHSYTVPQAMDWDADVLPLASEANYPAAVELLLGPKTYAKFVERHGRTIRAHVRLLNAVAEASNLEDLGNS